MRAGNDSNPMRAFSFFLLNSLLTSCAGGLGTVPNDTTHVEKAVQVSRDTSTGWVFYHGPAVTQEAEPEGFPEVEKSACMQTRIAWAIHDTFSQSTNGIEAIGVAPSTQPMTRATSFSLILYDKE